MVHETDTEAGRLIQERKKIKNQFVQFGDFKILSIPVDDWTPYFWTNNFIQRSFSYGIGFDADANTFRLLQVDVSGNLKVSSTVSVTFAALVAGVSTSLKGNDAGALKVDPTGRNLVAVTIADAVTIPSTQAISTTGLDIGEAGDTTVLVEATQNYTVRYQLSDDNSSWYDPKTEADVDINHSVVNEKIAFRVTMPARFIRLKINNTNATEGVVTAKVTYRG